MNCDVGEVTESLENELTTNFISRYIHTHIIHFVSFNFINFCTGATEVDDRHPSYSVNFRSFIAAHPSTRPCVGHELRIFIYI